MNLVIAAVIFALELLSGVGVLGCSGVFVALIIFIVYLSDRKAFPNALRVAPIYVLLGILTFASIQLNWHVAEGKAKPVIEACEKVHDQHGRYPATLNELTPQFLSSIPNAKYTLVGNRFGYSADPPSLYFAAMLHGIVTYDFQTRRWGTND